MNAHTSGELAPGLGASRGGVSRLVVGLAVAGTVLLALGAFWLSFTTLQDLAVLSGIPAGQAWVWPLIVDGVILEATVSVVALRDSAATARRFAWGLLAAGAGVSVAANVTHAIVASDTRVPALVAAVVASVPPLVLLAMTHLTVELTRNTTPVQPAHHVAVSRTVSRTADSNEHSSSAPAELPEATVPRSAEAADVTKAENPPQPGGDGRQNARVRALELHAEGIPKRRIAAVLGVHPTTVGRWVNAPELRQDGAPHD